MTTSRIILAGLLGGVAMFVWNAVAHMALPLGDAGIQELPNEEMVLATIKAGIGEKEGLYRFPALGLSANPTKEQQKAAMEKYPEKLATNPSGLLVYHPANSRPLAMPKWLTIEFLAEVVESLLVVFLLAQTRLLSFGGRIGFFVLAGILVAITTNVSYWNWDGFPGDYTVAYMTMQIVGFLCAGIVAALVLGKRRAPVA